MQPLPSQTPQPFFFFRGMGTTYVINVIDLAVDFLYHLDGDGSAFSFYPANVCHPSNNIVSALILEFLASKYGKKDKTEKVR